jgi:hypothetical protein
MFGLFKKKPKSEPKPVLAPPQPKAEAWQLRARGRGMSVYHEVFRVDDHVYPTKEAAEANGTAFLVAVTKLRAGRYDAIWPDQCVVEACRIELHRA